MKPSIAKKSRKEERMHEVLLGLVEYYIREGKPVGSHTLKEEGFPHLGAATLRNYFSHLEGRGLLTQEHSSGGRVPTNAAFRLYAHEFAHRITTSSHEDERLVNLRVNEDREVAAYLQQAAETLRELTQLPVVLTAPRFDQDFVTHIKVVPVDAGRFLCVVLTDFGVIQTEMFHHEQKMTTLAAGRTEAYFKWRLTGQNAPENLSDEEKELAQSLYNELMVRHIASYSSLSDEELFQTGLSELLAYPELQDTRVLANSLALLENGKALRLLLKETCSVGRLKYWIGEDFAPYCQTTPNCAIIAAPYHIGQSQAGAFGVIGPTRIPYREVFTILSLFTECVSEALTRNIYKYKISFRTPTKPPSTDLEREQTLLKDSQLVLLEDQS